MGVNDLGQVVGSTLNTTDDSNTLGGPDAFAYAINQFGDVAGVETCFVV